MRSNRNKKKNALMKIPSNADSSMEGLADSTPKVSRSRKASGSSSDSSDDEFAGMTAAEILATVQPSTSIPKSPNIDSSIDELAESTSEVSRSRTASSSSSDSSDDEFAGMTAAEILATVQPSTSIPKLNGVPLQHRLYIRSRNLEIIKKSGILLDRNIFNFTKKEDDLIRKNWTDFAKQNKFSGHIFEFLGYDEDGLILKPNYEVTSERTRNLVIWPFLCRGLDRRYAHTVSMRISHIFHPYFREEKQDYDVEEIKRRIDNKETLEEISESMKIPPRFLESKFSMKSANSPEITLPPTQRIIMLKFLIQAVLDNGENKFVRKNIDWKVFREKCRENSIEPPKASVLSYTYRKLMSRHDNMIFKHLEPPPTLKRKLTYFHEALLRYSMKKKRGKKTELPLVRPDILLTIVFEDYSKDVAWKPPKVLQELAKSKKVNVEKTLLRMKVVTEQRKRLSEASPKPRFRVVVKKKAKLDDLNNYSMSREEERLEISSIHESSLAPSIAASIDPFAYSEDDPLTDLELSSTNNTSSFANSRNETILAGGGAGEAMNNTTLGGGLNQTQISQKAQESVSLDLTQDIWSQLVGS